MLELLDLELEGVGVGLGGDQLVDVDGQLALLHVEEEERRHNLAATPGQESRRASSERECRGAQHDVWSFDKPITS